MGTREPDKLTDPLIAHEDLYRFAVDAGDFEPPALDWGRCCRAMLEEYTAVMDAPEEFYRSAGEYLLARAQREMAEFGPLDPANGEDFATLRTWAETLTAARRMGDGLPPVPGKRRSPESMVIALFAELLLEIGHDFRSIVIHAVLAGLFHPPTYSTVRGRRIDMARATDLVRKRVARERALGKTVFERIDAAGALDGWRTDFEEYYRWEVDGYPEDGKPAVVTRMLRSGGSAGDSDPSPDS